MGKKQITLIALFFGLVYNLYADIPIDDFERYDNTDSLQTTWLWVWSPTNGATLDRYLDTLDDPVNKVMRVEFGFPGGSTNAWGKIGRPGAWNWTGQTGIRLWIKGRTTGDPSQNFRIRFHEGDPDQQWGDKWISPYYSLDDLDTNGQYVEIRFADFTDFGGSGGVNDNGILQLENITAFYISPAYSGTAASGGTTTLWVDDCSTIADSGITRYPYLQNVTQNSVDVMWGTPAKSGTLYWGTSPGNYANSVSSSNFEDTGGNRIHTATITGMSPGDTVYYYVISGNDTVGLGDSSYYAVAAPDDDASFRFIAYGDTKYNSTYLPTYHGHVIDAMLPHDPGIVLHVGDIAEQGQLFEFDKYYFDFAAPLIKNTPMFMTIGNHELPYKASNYETQIQNYRDLYSLPSNNPENIEDYYSFDYGSVHFVSLNTQWLRPGSGTYDPTRAAEMKTWLENDLAATDKPWKVVFFHKQAFLDFVESQGWGPIFEQYGVNVVFYGHGHSYLSHYRNGITYVMTGGGGTRLGPPDLWAWPEYRINAFSDYHFVQVDVTPEKLLLNVYDDDNVLRHWIEVGADGNVVYPQLDLIDDFETYFSTLELQARWTSKYIPPEFDSLGVTLDHTLATGGESGTSNVMQLDFSFPAGSEGAWGAVGLSGQWNWSVHTGFNLWLKAQTTGDSDQSFQLRILEADGGDEWVATVPVDELDPTGEYVNVYFTAFKWYGAGNPDSSLANGVMDLDKIVAFYVGVSAGPGPATENSSATILVDDITAFIQPVTNTHLDDDFESYASNTNLATKWNMVYWGGNDQYNPYNVSMSRSLDSTGGVENSQAMRMDFSFSTGVNPSSNNLGVNWDPCIYGITGYLTPTEYQSDLTNYSGVRLWLKPGPVSGNDSIYFKLNLIEDEPAGTEEKWMSPKVYLNDLDTAGQYVYLDFNDFFQYYTDSPEPMERDHIKISFLWLAYDKTATENSSATIWVDDITYVPKLSVDQSATNIPERFALYQNYPNPFNPTTTIRYDLANTEDVKLTIYDILGRAVITLVNDRVAAGSHAAIWDGRDRYGVAVASGVYIYRLQAGDFATTKKLIMLK